tara:strand:+ start:496 stop:897 length:402 start_codon:yes stop_codon:yes gene_type:complete
MIKKKLIKIALNLDNYGLTKNRTHYAYYKNKVCGDKIEVELNVDKIKINTMRYETESCIYCQASASILSKIISSLSIKNLKKDKSLIHKVFHKKNSILPKKYILFKDLVNSKNKNRLECIMLPFDALIKALKI